ncbi:MAG: electron transfer flavoprotein subunit alpha/FixB family protein [Acidimicrobiales bacterium]
MTRLEGRARGRIRIESVWWDDDVETLSRATVVVGVGAGVEPGSYPEIGRLAALLDAELAGTRKVTDNGWLPRSRQIGITGRSISPRLYVAIGIKGKLNHMVGVREAGTVLAINCDRDAPIFRNCDVGIVGDWHDVVPRLVKGLRERDGSPPSETGQSHAAATMPAGTASETGGDPAVVSESSVATSVR